jgi:hypothetical protein
MPLIPLIFWGSALLSIAVSIVGVIRRSPRMLVVGAVLAGPLAFYLGATPLFGTWAWFLPGLHVAAAMAVRRSVSVAVILLVPFVSIAMWLAVIVVRQEVGGR